MPARCPWCGGLGLMFAVRLPSLQLSLLIECLLISLITAPASPAGDLLARSGMLHSIDHGLVRAGHYQVHNS